MSKKVIKFIAKTTAYKEIDTYSQNQTFFTAVKLYIERNRPDNVFD